MRRFLLCALGLPYFAALPACDAPDDSDDASVDGRDDGFIRGKADGGLEPAELAGVLSVVNTLALETLDISVRDGGVGLDRRAAEGIIELRAGDDGTLGTEDDEAFETLAQLDAVPYVGPVALERLLDFAHNEGFVVSADAAELVGSWIFDQFPRDSIHFQNYPTPLSRNDASGTIDGYGRVLVDVSLDEQGTPIASGRCQVFRRSDFTQSPDWNRAFSGVELIEVEPGVWTTTVREDFGNSSCDRHDGEKTCEFELRATGFGTATIEYDLPANWDGTCVKQSRSYRSWGIGGKD